MQLIYIAQSNQFPGMVKIGRTDRSVEERMEELSKEDYGTSGFTGNSEWEAIKVIEVKDSESAETILHNHFSEYRVENSRELFYADDPHELAEEAIQVVDGADFLHSFDSINALFGGLSIISVVAGVSVILRTFFPDNAEVWKLSKVLNNWEKRLKSKASSSENILVAILYSALWGSFSISKTIGEFVPRIVEDYVANIKENKSYMKLLNLQIELIGLKNVEYITALSLNKYHNNEITDLFNEQWRQFEIIWALKQKGEKVKDFNDDLLSLYFKINSPEREDKEFNINKGAFFVDDK